MKELFLLLTRLVVAIEAIAAAQGGAPKKTTAKPAEAPTEDDPPVDPRTGREADPADDVDYKSECRVLAQQLVNNDQKDAMLKALKKASGVDKISLIPEAKLQKTYEALKALVDV